MARPGRAPAPVPDPDTPLGRFAQALRDLRDQAGDPGYEALARESARLGTPYSATSLRTAASGRALPSWKATETFIRACVEFARRHPHRAHPATRHWNPESLLARWTPRWHELAFPHPTRTEPASPEPAPSPPDPSELTPPEPAPSEGAPAEADRSEPGRSEVVVAGARGFRGPRALEGMSRFIGREEELAEGERALGRARLVTVTGPGGVGKTRLVMRLAGRVAEGFPDGVSVVELAELDASMPVGQALAAALGVRVEAGREPLDAVARALDGRRTLLVLDNCEHVLAEVAGLVRALAGASREVRFLASSRQALNIAGEKVLVLGPLPLSRDGGESAAVELFLDRAAAVVPGFRLEELDRDVVHRVCHRLDGLPLALEIAARLLRVLSPQELLDRLGRRFRLLGEAGAEHAAPARHRSLRAVLDWSHDLCSDDERLAWERLSVCAGTVALADAEALASVEGAEPEAAFEAVAGLLDKSLLSRVESGGRSRLHLLETVRMYGREKLAASGGEEEARRRHRERYCGLAIEAEHSYASPRQGEWLLRLRAEHADLRQSFAPSPAGFPGSCGSVGVAGRGHQETVMNGVRGLWLYWLASGNLGECVLWTRTLVESWPVPPDPELAAAWGGMFWSSAMALLSQGDRAGAERLLDRIEETVPLDGDSRWLAAAVRQLRGLRALFDDDHAAAEAHSGAALRIGGHRPGLLTGQQALAQLGLCASARGERGEAEEYFLRALELSDACGETWHRSYLLWTLAVEYAETGRDDRAGELLRRSLEMKCALDDRLGMATVSESLAHLLARRGDPGKAALLLGASQALWSPAGTAHLWGFEQLLRTRERGLAELRRILGDGRFTAEYLEGGQLDLQSVLKLVLPSDG